jgi:hypothetical protein
MPMSVKKKPKSNFSFKFFFLSLLSFLVVLSRSSEQGFWKENKTLFCFVFSKLKNDSTNLVVQGLAGSLSLGFFTVGALGAPFAVLGVAYLIVNKHC